MNLRALRNIVKQSFNLFWIRYNRIPIMGPLRAIWAVSYKCNSRCNICTRWQEDNRRELSTEEAKHLLRLYSYLDVINLSLTGGEPLLREDFFELVNYANKAGIYIITTTTNGIAVNKYIDEILNSKLSLISISLDTLNPELYQKIRGVNALEKVIHNLEMLVSAKKKKRKGPTIAVSMILNAKNYRELPVIAEYCKRSGVDSFNFGAINELSKNRFEILDDGLKFNDSNCRKELERIIDNVLNKTKLKLRSSKSYYRNIPTFIFEPEKTRKIECWAGRLTIYTDPYGYVYPCDGRMKCFGNIKEESVKKIWYSKEFQKVRDEIANGIHPLCWMSCYAPFRFTPFNSFRHGIKKLIVRYI